MSKEFQDSYGAETPGRRHLLGGSTQERVKRKYWVASAIGALLFLAVCCLLFAVCCWLLAARLRLPSHLHVRGLWASKITHRKKLTPNTSSRERNVISRQWVLLSLFFFFFRIIIRAREAAWPFVLRRALSPADLFGGKAPVGALIGLLEQIC